MLTSDELRVMTACFLHSKLSIANGLFECLPIARSQEQVLELGVKEMKVLGFLDRAVVASMKGQFHAANNFFHVT